MTHKYHAKPQTIDGIRFASKAEARRYAELRLLERAGEISRLELQPRFDLIVNGVRCGFYKSDFGYYTPTSRLIEGNYALDKVAPKSSIAPTGRRNDGSRP